jgi:hypothetical protein
MISFAVFLCCQGNELTKCHYPEPNPGPITPKFPCGACQKAVKTIDQGIMCDNCNSWLMSFLFLSDWQLTTIILTFSVSFGSGRLLCFVILLLCSFDSFGDDIICGVPVLPDVIIGTEYWLDPSIKDGDIFPEEFKGNVYRKDRKSDHHGGVFVAIKNTFDVVQGTE